MRDREKMKGKITFKWLEIKTTKRKQQHRTHNLKAYRHIYANERTWWTFTLYKSNLGVHGLSTRPAATSNRERERASTILLDEVIDLIKSGNVIGGVEEGGWRQPWAYLILGRNSLIRCEVMIKKFGKPCWRSEKTFSRFRLIGIGCNRMIYFTSDKKLKTNMIIIQEVKVCCWLRTSKINLAEKLNFFINCSAAASAALCTAKTFGAMMMFHFIFEQTLCSSNG